MSEGGQHKAILAVDTALGACSVAVLEDGAILAHRFQEMTRGHAEALAPMVDETMRQAGIAFGALDRLAVTTGPGTFTGQRVGLAFMRGLRVGLKKPLIGVTTLEAMAAATGKNRAAAIHDAKRDEAYLSLWENGAAILAPVVMSFADAVARIRSFGSCALCGTGAEKAGEALGPDFAVTDIRQPDALWVARLAITRPIPDLPPAPLYLRAPDAKLPGEHRPGKVEARAAGEPGSRPDVRPNTGSNGQEKCEAVFRPDVRPNTGSNGQEKCEAVFRPDVRPNK